MLLLTSEAPIAEEVRAELVRLATTTGADVEVVQDHEPLRHVGGVGVLLRYQHDQDAIAS